MTLGPGQLPGRGNVDLTTGQKTLASTSNNMGESEAHQADPAQVQNHRALLLSKPRQTQPEQIVPGLRANPTPVGEKSADRGVEEVYNELGKENEPVMKPSPLNASSSGITRFIYLTLGATLYFVLVQISHGSNGKVLHGR